MRRVESGVESVHGISGYALNAVDAKGRVSLPAGFRDTIELRAEDARKAGHSFQSKQVHLGEDAKQPCLVGFDELARAQFYLDARQRSAAAVDNDGSLIRRDGGRATFAPMMPVSFDKAGRMVLSGFLLERAGISDHAFFVGYGDLFDIWDPVRAHSHFIAANDQPMVNIVEYLCREKGVKL